MSYYYSKVLKSTFEEATDAMSQALNEEGFEILSKIDIKETMKKELNIEAQKYLIFGACCPSFAYLAINAEDKIGVLLPCNIIVKEIGGGNVEVAAVDPAVLMKAAKNPTLNKLAKKMQEKIKRVVGRLI